MKDETEQPPENIVNVTRKNDKCQAVRWLFDYQIIGEPHQEWFQKLIDGYRIFKLKKPSPGGILYRYRDGADVISLFKDNILISDSTNILYPIEKQLFYKLFYIPRKTIKYEHPDF